MKGPVAVLPQEVVEAQPQLLKDHADVASVVKPLPQVHTMVVPLLIVARQGVQHLQLQLTQL